MIDNFWRNFFLHASYISYYELNILLQRRINNSRNNKTNTNWTKSK